MRTLLRFTAGAALLAAFSAPTRAQGFLGGLTKKISDEATQKAQDKVSSKLDEMSQKMLDNSFDAMFGSGEKPAAKPPAPGANAGAGGASTGSAAGTTTAPAGATANASPFWTNNSAKTESSYNFNIVTTMEIATSKNASDKAILKMHYNTKEAYTGTLIMSADPKKQQQGSAFVILDAKNQAMVMLMASDKSKFSMAYGWSDAQKYAASAGGSASVAPAEPVNWDTVKVWKNYSRIGSKTIAGYSADGYRIETADGNAELWVSHDARLNVGNMFAANSGLKQMRGRIPDDYPQGMLLQLTGVNSKDGETVTMTVTSVDTNANVTYNMADYPKMGAEKK
ncbi:MAG: hypothetical protein ACREN6_16575 [Gemmatimonadaceae bacterium]